MRSVRSTPILRGNPHSRDGGLAARSRRGEPARDGIMRAFERGAVSAPRVFRVGSALNPALTTCQRYSAHGARRAATQSPPRRPHTTERHEAPKARAARLRLLAARIPTAHTRPTMTAQLKNLHGDVLDTRVIERRKDIP